MKTIHAVDTRDVKQQAVVACYGVLNVMKLLTLNKDRVVFITHAIKYLQGVLSKLEQ